LAASTVYYQASNIRQFGQAPNSKQKNFNNEQFNLNANNDKVLRDKK
jgi:hypothetical protein